MARQAWQRTITDAAGNVLTGVQITVFQENGVTLATIYGQQTGGAALANPFSTGAQTSAKFYADPGRYVVRAFKDGLTQEFTDVDIGGKAVRDDLGSAAYLVASDGARDTTFGRAFKTGDFGVGNTTVAVPFGDLNQATGSGFYRQETPTNGINYSGTLHMQSGDGRQQLTIDRQGDRAAFRGSPNVTLGTDAAFGPWRELYHTGNALGVVRSPIWDPAYGASAIIERGSNSNGEYTKFADGTLVCQFNRTGALGTSNYSASLPGLKIGFFYWFFPAQFVSAPSVNAAGVDNVSTGWASVQVGGGSQATVQYYTTTSNPTDTLVCLTAVGRWR